MKTENLAKNFGGVAHVLGGTCVAIAYTLHPHHQSPEIVAGQFWLVIHILFALSLIFGIFGLIGLFPMIVVKVGSVLFGSGLIGLGIASIRSQSESS